MSARALTVHFADFDEDRDATGPVVLSPPGLLRWLVGTWFASRDGATILNRRTWTVLGLWDEVVAAVESLDHLGRNLSWMAGADAVWSMAAVPIRSVGTNDHLGASPSGGTWIIDSTVGDDEPVFSITTVGYNTPASEVHPDRLHQFMKAGVHLATTVNEATGNLGHRSVTAAHPSDRFDGGNLSLWSSMRALTDYAYGTTPHHHYIGQHRAYPGGFFDRSSFSRFRLLRSEGTLAPWCTVNASTR